MKTILLLLALSVSVFATGIPPYGYPPDNMYGLTNGASGQELADPSSSTTAGTHMIQWWFLNTPDQFWYVHYIGTDPSGTPWYTLENMASEMFLVDEFDGKVNQDWPEDTTWTDTEWTPQNGPPRPHSPPQTPDTSCNTCQLHVPIIIDDAAPIPLTAATSYDQFLWTFDANLGGWMLRNRASGNVIDDPSYSTLQGKEMVMWSANGGYNQTWTLH